mmetsp:Transcript_20667/g.38347  ORF Transcript_20667/g.38347 Transcript_20667/m.38347 type:complete len:120 (+) Transcript_20667:1964-2323(+)
MIYKTRIIFLSSITFIILFHHFLHKHYLPGFWAYLATMHLVHKVPRRWKHKQGSTPSTFVASASGFASLLMIGLKFVTVVFDSVEDSMHCCIDLSTTAPTPPLTLPALPFNSKKSAAKE